MAFKDPLPAAPGRHTVPLERGWAAVFLQLFPGGPVAAVGLLRRGHLKEVVDAPRRQGEPPMGAPLKVHVTRVSGCCWTMPAQCFTARSNG